MANPRLAPTVGNRPVKWASRTDAKTSDGIELLLVVGLGVLQEPVVDGVQVREEEIIHGSIMAHHEPGNALRKVGCAQGLATFAETDSGRTAPGRLAREIRDRAPRHPGRDSPGDAWQ